MKKHITFKKYIAVILTLTLVLNLLGMSPDFCQFYKNHIYGYIASAVGFLTSGIPFLLGEILMYIGAIMLVVLVIMALCFIFLRRNEAYRTFLKKYLKLVVNITITMLFIYTTNWVLPFRAPHLDVNPELNKKYTVNELQIVRNYTVEHLNQVASSIDRDEQRHVVLSDDLRRDVSTAMNGVANQYPLLAGYYPQAKPSLCSSFLEWMRIAGFTYPYTMEVSFNKYTDYMYLPVLYSHEESHHKGYYQENEATFLSIISCINSESKYLQYSGYLELYRYIEKDYIESMLRVYEDEQAVKLILEQPQVIDLVKEDRADSFAKSKELYEKSVSAEFEKLFKSYTESVGDAAWEAQGEIIGEATYSGCVKYLLEYYDGILY